MPAAKFYLQHARSGGIYKGIRRLFCPNRGRRPVPRPHLKSIRQRKQLLFDAGDQIRCMAARQVRPTDAPLKQNVATDDPLARCVNQNHVARRMARREANLQFCLSATDGLVGAQIGTQWRQRIHGDAIHRR